MTGGPPLTPAMVLGGYAHGIFPMARSRGSAIIDWIEPRLRGILPLDGFHISRSLRRRIAQGGYEVRVDHDFAATVLACAAREETWINDPILAIYADLHRIGHAHSLEVWTGGEMIGGVYGVTLGAAFFGESMFSRQTDASKIALAWLVHRLRAGGFTVLDTQFLTPHLQSLGGVEIPQAGYLKLLAPALRRTGNFTPPGYAPTARAVSLSGS